MIKNSICGGCGRSIQSEYIFCPWCGKNQKAAAGKDYLEAAVTEGEIRRNDMKEQKLQQLEQQLAKLEKELNVLVLCAEMAR